MRILLGSGGFRTPERVSMLAEAMRGYFGAISRLLFVPYALADHDGYVKTMTERGLNAGYALDGLHNHPDPVHAIQAAEGIFVGGGNTFRLLAALYRLGLLDVIRERVRNGMPYLGISAGSNVACPTIKTTNDMPIVQPPSLDALGLVPFQVNPHYFLGTSFVRQGDSYVEHFGETRDDRLREFHEENETPVIGLWEAGILHCEGGQVMLTGAPARIFRKGQEPVDVEPGTDLARFAVTPLQRLSLHSRDDDLQKLPCPPGQPVDVLRSAGPGQRRSEDVLAAERHGATRERHRRQQPVVVDLAQAGTAILILRKHPMVLDAEAAHRAGTLGQVRQRIDLVVIHHVTGVVADLDAVVVHLADNLGQGGPGAGVAAVLLDRDQHAVIPRDRPQFLEIAHPHLAIVAPRVAHGQHLADPRRGGLADAAASCRRASPGTGQTA